MVAASAVWSLPLRERGLKLLGQLRTKLTYISVAPLAGAWIEISVNKIPGVAIDVAPLAGAWIEIPHFFKV